MFFKKEVSLLTEEDKKNLLDIERKAYLEEAEKLVKIRGIRKANSDLGIPKEVKKDPWQM